jgi:glycosyltransferase involved in cell wall biosynthesis
MNVAIDFSRRMSGGGIAHAKGLLESKPSVEFNIEKVFVFSSWKFLDKIPDKPWIIKKSHSWLNKSTFWQMLWQLYYFKKEVKKYNCSSVLFPAASTLVTTPKCVVMSRDMLPFERVEVNRYARLSFAWFRLIALRQIYISSLRKAIVPLYLTKYAADVTSEIIGKRKHVIIPHGVNPDYIGKSKNKCEWPDNSSKPIKCIYISTIAYYKHQWKVLEAVSMLREEGYNIEISFVGGSRKEALKLFNKSKFQIDPDERFHKLYPFIPNEQLPDMILDHHVYIFASSCENMPNTLLEGMALGMPIVSSNRGPMMEVLGDGGLYFDPEDSASISKTLKRIISDKNLRNESSNNAINKSSEYSWKKTSFETFKLLSELG